MSELLGSFCSISKLHFETCHFRPGRYKVFVVIVDAAGSAETF